MLLHGHLNIQHVTLLYLLVIQPFLPVGFGVLFEISLLACKALHERQLVYLLSMLAASIPSRSLRSNNDNSLLVPRVKTNTGARAFHS